MILPSKKQNSLGQGCCRTATMLSNSSYMTTALSLTQLSEFLDIRKEIVNFKCKAISIFLASPNRSLLNYSSSFSEGTIFLLNYFRFWQTYKQRIFVPRKLYQLFQQSIFQVVQVSHNFSSTVNYQNAVKDNKYYLNLMIFQSRKII